MANGYALCEHLKANGIYCGSPALRGLRHCYFHHEHYQALARNRGKAKRAACALPPLEDANSVQVALMEVSRALLEDRIELKRAALLLYSLQIASANLKRVNFEPVQLQLAAERALKARAAKAEAKQAVPASAKPQTQPAAQNGPEQQSPGPQPRSRDEVMQDLRNIITPTVPTLQQIAATRRPPQTAPAEQPLHDYLMTDRTIEHKNDGGNALKSSVATAPPRSSI